MVWAISAEMVTGAKREASRRQAESTVKLNRQNRYDYSRFASISAPGQSLSKEVPIDQSNHHSFPIANNDYNMLQQHFEVMNKNYLTRREDNTEEMNDWQQNQSQLNGESSMANNQHLTNENLAKLIEKLLASHKLQSSNNKNRMSLNNSQNKDWIQVETSVVSQSKPQAFELKMPVADKKESKSNSKAPAKKKPIVNSNNSNNNNSNKKSTKLTKPNKPNPPASQKPLINKKTQPKVKPQPKPTNPPNNKKVAKTKVYEKKLDRLMDKIKELEKQQKIKPAQKEVKIPDNVLKSSLMREEPSRIADKIKQFINYDSDDEEIGTEASQQHETISSPPENQWEHGSSEMFPPIPPMPPVPFMPFMPHPIPMMPTMDQSSMPQSSYPDESMLNQQPMTNGYNQQTMPGMDVENNYQQQFPVQQMSTAMPDQHQQYPPPQYPQYSQNNPMNIGDGSNVGYGNMAPSNSDMYNNYKPEESVYPPQHQQPPPQQQQPPQQQSMPSSPPPQQSPIPPMPSQQSSQGNSIGETDFLAQESSIRASAQKTSKSSQKKSRRFFSRKFKLSNIINSVMPKKMKQQEYEKQPIQELDNNNPPSTPPMDSMAVQESQPYSSVDRGYGYYEQPGKQMSYGGGPIGGGSQLKLNPLGIIKSIMLPTMTKPSLGLQGKVVIGLVLENSPSGGGHKKKPKTVFQHYSTGRI